jgi:hypothetical protein
MKIQDFNKITIAEKRERRRSNWANVEAAQQYPAGMNLNTGELVRFTENGTVTPLGAPPWVQYVDYTTPVRINAAATDTATTAFWNDIWNDVRNKIVTGVDWGEL